MVEVMAMPDSIWVGKSAGGANFRQSTGMTVLAIHSPGRKRDYRRRLARQRIKAGDVLLLQGSVEDIERLEDDKSLVRALRRQMIGTADARNTRAYNQHVEMFAVRDTRCFGQG